jgi:hypothetical protein
MTLVSQSISLFVSSDPESGSKNLSQTGHSFSVDMNPSLDIKQRYTPYLRLLKASVWWSIPNINQILYNNNRLVISNDGVNNLTLDLPNGLYDITALQTAVSDFLANNAIDRNTILINGIEATGQIGITIGNPSMRILWNLSTIAPFLGWSQLSPNSGPGIAGFTYTSPEVANFNSLESILVHCSICSGGYTSRRGNSDIIGIINPNVRAGSLISYEPYNTFKVSVNSRHISNITFFLTDQNNNVIDTGGEYFSIFCELILIPE